MKRSEAQATFTPVFETVLREVGLLAALVYGRVWRYCQAPGGECYASQRTLARELGLSDTTVYRALKRLVAAGYIEDRTARQRHAPHRYRDTGKVSASEGSRVLPQEADEPKSASVGGIKIQDPKRQKKRQTRGEAAAAELRVFREAAGIWPRKQVFEEVIEAVRAVGKRLGRETKAEDLRPFVKAWVGRGWNPYNLNWLYQWAVSGSMANGNNIVRDNPARDEVSAGERERLIRFYNGRGEG